jgi:hypothetical protein
MNTDNNYQQITANLCCHDLAFGLGFDDNEDFQRATAELCTASLVTSIISYSNLYNSSDGISRFLNNYIDANYNGSLTCRANSISTSAGNIQQGVSRSRTTLKLCDKAVENDDYTRIDQILHNGESCYLSKSGFVRVPEPYNELNGFDLRYSAPRGRPKLQLAGNWGVFCKMGKKLVFRGFYSMVETRTIPCEIHGQRNIFFLSRVTY